MVSGVVAIIVSVLASILSYRTKVDEGLRDKRLMLYKVLWKKTELLPKWPRRTDVTYEKLREFSEELQKWYFDEGGIFLSRQARKSYGKLQEGIGEILSLQPKGALSDPAYDEIRSRCGNLRLRLTDDLSSRTGAHR